MQDARSHLSDQQLLCLLDRELEAADAKLARTHLENCGECRIRSQAFAKAAADVSLTHRNESDDNPLTAARAREALKHRLAQLRPSPLFFLRRSFLYATPVCGLLALAYFSWPGHPAPPSFIVSSPDSTLTPGAARSLSRQAVCAQQNVKNKAVPVSVRQKVFAEYRIPGADPEGYEIDYLITPALGGADELQNLWPHSYTATVWNARVKDQLEDRLRDLVCDGTLDLTAAQHEIAGDWIAAYKRRFHTEKPLR